MNDPERPNEWATADAAGLTVPSSPRSVALVRRYAVDAAEAHGWVGEAADTVALLVSEVVTNAVLHAYGPEIRAQVRQDGGRLRVEVFDGSPVLPVQRQALAHAEGGRGLALVEALAGAWGVDTRPDGKTFWFELEA